MDKNNDRVQASIQKLYDFRSNIPANLPVRKIKEVWEGDIELEKFPELISSRDDLIEEKVGIAKKSLSWLVFKPFVRFIGISGSVASEFAQREDDIDLFVVVKSDTAWIYRLYIYFINLFKKRIRSKEKVERGESVKDKLCINFITEERNLRFEDDLFNLNELLFLKPIYNEEYLRVIFINNPWLNERYLVSNEFLQKEWVRIKDVKDLAKRNYLFFIPNLIAFLGQVVYMALMRHSPDLKRLWNGFREGRIEFYPKDFRKEKLEDTKTG
jgi:hypothetical protein